VPNGLSTDHAALTEPLAVGVHAVEKAALKGDEAPLVVGCGPVGLAVVAALRLKGIRPIVAADFSPKRRELAVRMGADIVVDPALESPYVKLDPGKRAAIFECVGVPGVLQQMFEQVPRDARVVVVGVCMEPDTIEPMFGIVKELSLQFVLGYTPEELISQPFIEFVHPDDRTATHREIRAIAGGHPLEHRGLAGCHPS
jgi:threonine dehydrogenase-like Zn-dependent dehydrogenase